MSYDFSGITFRIWGVCGILFLIGLLCILLEKPWSKSFRLRDAKIGLLTITVAACLSAVYAFRILSPDVSVYTGEYVESHRNSRVAPPLPFTYEYIFSDGTSPRPIFYLDTFSRQEIWPQGFTEGDIYTIYYDEFTNVIVRVELAEE